jgi:hypothetical protein
MGFPPSGRGNLSNFIFAIKHKNKSSKKEKSHQYVITL